MVLYVALWCNVVQRGATWCNVVQRGASFRQSHCQQIWATNPYLRQQIYNKFNEKRANKQQIKEGKNV
tara:strand:+ start:1750 stop:1953 length:204 start_codon:yes stop_codon:yes gene_type:complete